jgi:hypothetical protein
MSRIINSISSAATRLLGRLILPCHDISRLSSQALDTRLPPITRFRMRMHYLVCVWCRRYRDQLALLRRACAQLDASTPEAGPGLPPTARERIRQHLCDHDGH